VGLEDTARDLSFLVKLVYDAATDQTYSLDTWRTMSDDERVWRSDTIRGRGQQEDPIRHDEFVLDTIAMLHVLRAEDLSVLSMLAYAAPQDLEGLLPRITREGEESGPTASDTDVDTCLAQHAQASTAPTNPPLSAHEG
jgi:hypothetical protein